MTIASRLALIFRARANDALDRAEDPRQTLDYSYSRQVEMLRDVRRGVADVATARKRLEIQAQGLHASADKLQQQAAQALAADREDLAREALARRVVAEQQLAELGRQHASLKAQEDKLVDASRRLQAKVDAFRIRKETMKANYSAAEAQTRIGEAVSGISEEMRDVGLAMQRAEDRTQQMQARAGAIDELMASGALDDPTGSTKDDIQAELDRLSADSSIELELARLRSALPAEPARQQIMGADRPPAGGDS